LEWLEQRKLDAYLPDSNMAREMNLGKKCRGPARRAVHGRMPKTTKSPRTKSLYSAQGNRRARLRGVKKQRGMSQFRTRGKNSLSSSPWQTLPTTHTDVLGHHARHNSNEHPFAACSSA
jgi:hypothetical protein